MENWNSYVDLYCERTMPGLWNEPLNAVTNLAFIISALVVLRLFRNEHIFVVKILMLNLAAIGIGSGLFHTFASRWASLLDVLAIASFIFVYLYAANRHFLGLSTMWSTALTVLAIPYTPLTTFGLLQLLPELGGSATYASINLLIYGYALLLWGRFPVLARQLLVGALLLSVSIGFRIVDGPVCTSLPVGTHWVWHLLNAVMLGWMIIALRSHTVANRRGPTPTT